MSTISAANFVFVASKVLKLFPFEIVQFKKKTLYVYGTYVHLRMYLMGANPDALHLSWTTTR